MRNLDTPVKQIRRKIFTEIAKIGFESTDESLIHDIESIPYNIVEERAKYRESIYRERAVASERVRLAMGLSLRPENRSVHLTDGVKASNIDEKYYEPPLMQVIPSACSACESNKYEVSNMCRGCVAHPCMLTCPKGAISMVDGKSFIDQDKCIHCGRCKSVCPYDAIAHKERPCERACGVKAIESDEQGRASINQDKCAWSAAHSEPSPTNPRFSSCPTPFAKEPRSLQKSPPPTSTSSAKTSPRANSAPPLNSWASQTFMR